jgi:hypothetical protein
MLTRTKRNIFEMFYSGKSFLNQFFSCLIYPLLNHFIIPFYQKIAQKAILHQICAQLIWLLELLHKADSIKTSINNLTRLLSASN